MASRVSSSYLMSILHTFHQVVATIFSTADQSDNLHLQRNGTQFKRECGISVVSFSWA